MFCAVFSACDPDTRALFEENRRVGVVGYAIARNRIVDARRRASVRPGLAPADQEKPPEELDRELEQAVLRWQVAAALSRLSPEHREVIRLAHWSGLSLREIAERKGIPLGTAKSRAYYALQTLRLILDEMEVER